MKLAVYQSCIHLMSDCSRYALRYRNVCKRWIFFFYVDSTCTCWN